MAKKKPAGTTPNARGQSNKGKITELIDALNEDLAREYQAIIAYTVYSNVLTGAQWMKIAAELQLHAGEELAHAMIIADQIDYLGGKPTATPKPVKLSDKAEDMIRFDLDNETETIRNYRQRIKQAEAIGHYALAEQLRKIVAQEQEHQHDLATALGVDVPRVFEDGA
jgi:bacterioferritin